MDRDNDGTVPRTASLKARAEEGGCYLLINAAKNEVTDWLISLLA